MTTALSMPAIADSGGDEPDTWPAAPEAVDSLPGLLDRWLAARGADLIAWRRHIHAHPELSGKEVKTAAFVARELRRLGLAPRLLPSRNGVICDIGSGDRVIALRADMDALPVQDNKDVPYRSTVANVCHACGHDVHTAVLLGAGSALADLHAQGQLPGRVRLIFQPCEERLPSGAPLMISFGCLKEVAAIFALHCFPQLPAGLVGIRSGPLTAATDMIDVRLAGRGGHTARPHLTADIVHALSRVVTEVPTLLSRRTDPRFAPSLVFGSIRAGEAANIIPVEGTLRGTVRTLSREAWNDLPEILPALVKAAVAGTGVDVHVDYIRGMPPVINDRHATAIVAGAAAAALGPDRVVEAEISMGAEDFAFYAEQVPAAMVRLGVGFKGEPRAFDIHQADFDVDERAIGYGVRVFVHTALAALSTGLL